jgi:hypothetical protein
MSSHRPLTRFEQRRRRVKIHRRDMVLFGADPEFTGRLEAFEHDILTRAAAEHPKVAAFAEWWIDEARKYGAPVKAGIVVLYATWATRDEEGRPVLSDERFGALRDRVAEAMGHKTIDGRIVSGREFVQEFIWWSAGDWTVQPHVLEAIEEFEEFYAAGRFRDWKRRKRRRLAAARRKASKGVYLGPAGDAPTETPDL